MRRLRCARSLAPLALLLAFSAVSLLTAPLLSAAHIDPALGKQIADFSLKSQFGKPYSLKELAERDVVVVVFLGTECPLAKLYGPRLAELAEKFDAKRVAILGIDSNQQDSIQEIAAYATRHKIEFPILKDPGNTVADQFGAERTPEVFVLDRQRKVVYHGRVDDQYGFNDGVGYQRPKATRSDLGAAVEELLSDKPVSVAHTAIVGCRIGRVAAVNDKSEVTYSKQIARVFQENCVDCHRPGRIGPFDMTKYEELVGWGPMIREVVEDGRMPPWHASPEHQKFANDSRLSDDEKKLIVTWVENGCPQGDPKDLPEPKQYTEGWQIGEPDQVVYMRKEPVKVPAEGVIEYHHYTVDPGWTEDKWISAAEARPGSLETVHHILVFIQPPDGSGGGLGRGGFGGRGRSGGIGGGNMIAAYAPGANPLINSDGSTAMFVKAGSKLLFQMHYTPNGVEQTDLSFIGLKFADPDKVQNVARSTSISNFFFAIPPGDSNYEVTSECVFENDTILTNMTPHMHMRGKSFRYEVTYPDGNKEILLDVPSYDFNWQTTYFLEEPKKLPKGTQLVCTAHWDNSEENLSNPDPKRTVSWGDQSFEEMMIGFYVEVHPKGQVPDRASGGRGLDNLDPAKIFRNLDANGDGKLTKEEVPDRVAERFNFADVNGDGTVSEAELTLLLKVFAATNSERAGGKKERKRDTP